MRHDASMNLNPRIAAALRSRASSTLLKHPNPCKALNQQYFWRESE